MNLVIVGIGGHGRVVLDAVLLQSQYGHDLQLIGFADDDSSLYGKEIAGLPVLGPINEILQYPCDAVIVAIGSNARRKIVAEFLHDCGISLRTIFHPSAIVSPSAVISDGVFVAAGVVIGAGSTLGRGVIVNTQSSVDHDSNIGAWAHVCPGCTITGEVCIGEGAFVGSGTTVVPRRRIGKNVVNA
jgi:sugar O-acyltransferase (sialic acid O-acetyltransferase NeuD family)